MNCSHPSSQRRGGCNSFTPSVTDDDLQASTSAAVIITAARYRACASRTAATVRNPLDIPVWNAIKGSFGGFLMKKQRTARLIFAGVCLITLFSFWTIAQNVPAGRPANTGPQQKTLALRGGLLIDGTGGAPLTNSVVVISGGKIQSVGREGSVTIPPDATIIDTSGKTIIPGLVDSHIHFRNFHAPSYLYWGVTSVGDLGNATGWILSYRDAIAKGRAAGPYIMAAGTKFDAPMQSGDAPAAGDVGTFDTFLAGNTQMTYITDPASAEKAVAAAKAAGVDAIKLYTRLDPSLMKAAAQTAHRYGLPVFAHYTSANLRQGKVLGIEDVLDTGIDVNVHLYALVKSTAPSEVLARIARGENVQAFHLLDTSKFPALINQMLEKKMFLNPTLHQFERASKNYGEYARLNNAFVTTPLVKNLPDAIRARYAGAYSGNAPAARRNNAELEEGFKRAGMFVRQYVERGGKIIAGDDFGSGLGSPGLALHEEMQLLSEVGVKPMQVIQAATIWSMEAWGKAKEAGTVEAGKRADLLVLNRNPLDDMSATSDIFRIVQGGAVVDRESLASWKEPLPRPMPVQSGDYPNLLLHIPFVLEVSPEAISVNAKAGTELTIRGQNFSTDNLVLLNDRLVPAKSRTESELKVQVPAEVLKRPGVYPLSVVQPGSAGGVSNPLYLIVNPN